MFGQRIGVKAQKRAENRTVILLARTANTAIRVGIVTEVPEGYTDPLLEYEGLLGLRLLGSRCFSDSGLW